MPTIRPAGPDVGLAGEVFAGDDYPGIGGRWAGEDMAFGVNNLRMLTADSLFGPGFRPFEDGEQSSVHQSQDAKERGTDKSKEDGHRRRKEHEQALNPTQKGVVRMWVVPRT